MNHIDLTQRVSAQYTFKKVNKITGEEVDIPGVSPNLLTDEFFRRVLTQGTSGNWMSSIVVGTGTNTPLPTDTNLGAFVAASVTNIGSSVREVNSTIFPRYVKNGFTRRFDGTAIANQPLSEVGVALTSGPTTNAGPSTVLASRALIVDQYGNPTTITVLADEFLDITYTLTTYAMDGVVGSFDINVLGTVETFNYEIRPVFMSNTTENGWAEGTSSSRYAIAGTCIPSGSAVVDSVETVSSTKDTFFDPSDSSTSIPNIGRFIKGTMYPPTWNASTKTATSSLTLPLSNGNDAAGIRSIFLRFQGGDRLSNPIIMGPHQMLLDRPIMKTSDHVFEFPIVMSLSNATPPGV